MSLYFTLNPSPPYSWVLLDSKGVRQSGEVESLSDLPAAGQRCVVVVPGEQVVTQTVSLPVRNRQKLIAAIPYAVEDNLVSPVSQLHFSLLNVGTDNRVAFAYVSRIVMDGWMQQLQEAGIVADAIVPDYLLLPREDPSAKVISFSYDGRIFIRSSPWQGAVSNLHNLPAWLNEQDAEVPLIVDSKLADKLPEDFSGKVSTAAIGHTLADWLAPAVPQHDAVLLSGEYSQSGKTRNIRQNWPAVAMLLLAVFIKVGSDITELVWLQQTKSALDQQTQSLFQELFPGSKLLPGKARTQTRNKLASLRSQSGSNDFSYLLVTTVDLLQGLQATVEELDYRDGNLVTVLTLNDFAHLDRVRQQLQEDPSIEVSMKQSGASGSKVQARFEISRAAS